MTIMMIIAMNHFPKDGRYGASYDHKDGPNNDSNGDDDSDLPRKGVQSFRNDAH